jgi:hypothetical protein
MFFTKLMTTWVIQLLAQNPYRDIADVHFDGILSGNVTENKPKLCQPKIEILQYRRISSLVALEIIVIIFDNS